MAPALKHLCCVHAAQHGGGDAAGCPGRGMRLLGIAIGLFALDFGEMDDALLVPTITVPTPAIFSRWQEFM